MSNSQKTIVSVYNQREPKNLHEDILVVFNLYESSVAISKKERYNMHAMYVRSISVSPIQVNEA